MGPDVTPDGTPDALADELDRLGLAYEAAVRAGALAEAIERTREASALDVELADDWRQRRHVLEQVMAGAWIAAAAWAERLGVVDDPLGALLATTLHTAGEAQILAGLEERGVIGGELTGAGPASAWLLGEIVEHWRAALDAGVEDDDVDDALAGAISALLWLDRAREALPLARRLMLRTPAAAHDPMIRALVRTGRADDAWAHAERADQAFEWMVLGYELASASPQRADTAFQRALALAPEDTFILREYEDFLAGTGRQALADEIRARRHALERLPRD